MNWFKKHLNWTLLLAVVVISVSEAQIAIASSSIGQALAWPMLILLLFAGGWVLKQKGQSLFHLFWFVLSWVGVVVMCLSNKRSLEDI